MATVHHKENAELMDQETQRMVHLMDAADVQKTFANPFAMDLENIAQVSTSTLPHHTQLHQVLAGFKPRMQSKEIMKPMPIVILRQKEEDHQAMMQAMMEPMMEAMMEINKKVIMVKTTTAMIKSQGQIRKTTKTKMINNHLKKRIKRKKIQSPQKKEFAKTNAVLQVIAALDCSAAQVIRCVWTDKPTQLPDQPVPHINKEMVQTNKTEVRIKKESQKKRKMTTLQHLNHPEDQIIHLQKNQLLDHKDQAIATKRMNNAIQT